MKFDWQWTGALVFCVVFIGIVTLVALGKAPPEMVGLVISWLVPSPIQSQKKELVQ